MTKQEALDKIKELEDYIKQLDNKVGFEDDKIFLLSIEEYRRYKDKIPHIKTCWWLRSQGYNYMYATYIDDSGCMEDDFLVEYVYVGIRPALNFSNLESEITDSKEKDCFVWNEVKWKIIDEENKIAISYMPINFDKFDIASNNYENSCIRQWLLDWVR